MLKDDFIKMFQDRYGITIKFTDKEFELFCKLPQADKVWWHLKKTGKITNKECHDVYGIRHCPSVIRDIRNNPFTYGDNHFYIESVRVDGEADRFGKATFHDIYTLKQYT